MIKNAEKLNSRIWLSAPHMSGYEDEFIKKAFESNWIAPLGPNLEGFEKDIETFLGHQSQVVALNSGTAAIHLALVLLNIGKGDEVICQTKTFVASVNPVTYVGATPVFVDSESETWNMSPELLEKAIKDRLKKGKKPKAIIIINLYGMPYHVDRIQELSEQYQIPVIEDSAEALGSKYKGKPCGTFGDLSILSFNGNKIITTSGGGALISKSEQIKDKAIFLATQAKNPGVEYSHSETGYNYRMSNILAGIGRGQMKVLEDYVELRRRNFDYYFDALKDINEIIFLKEPINYYSNRWLTCVLLETNKMRNDLLKLLSDNNIEARPSWKPMHQQELFKSFPKYLNGQADKLYERGLCLPSGSSLTKDDLLKITTLIKSYFE
ncbi:DegT/DnrJ/EryC1/StrS family aminotransferase [Hanstruepera ponticola]|uniref:DegT/DnrJ/EryC1/StrS family aminotransferase n=1 Tax=Hanstruepera ponticola TaxID=2042995 RepID=UPI0017841B1D|nr:aminotransferase class I/II-fold pyridoxal phosphate-dependent enzyme [Hanstruepera ponticola]